MKIALNPKSGSRFVQHSTSRGHPYVPVRSDSLFYFHQLSVLSGDEDIQALEI
jgi:hypothetical protein